jgi:RHS repeat-associated protein
MDGDHRFATVETRNGVDDGTEQRLVRYQLHNHQGSACLELDGSADARVISYEEYHPHGTTAYQARGGAVRSAAKRYRFTGMERDEESGLEYHGVRYYAPWLGRWISTDRRLREGVSRAAPSGSAAPAGEKPERSQRDEPQRSARRIRRSPGQDGNADPRDLNPYAYASQNPLLYRDPSGEVPILQAWYDGAKNASGAGKVGYGFLFIFAWLAHVIVNLVVLALSVTLFNLGGLFGALDFSWAAPQSLLGLAAGIVLTLFGADVSPRWGLGAKVEMPAYMGNPGGMSLGPVVLAGHGFNDFKHEFGHTWQSRLLGPLYLLVIGIPSLISAASDPSNHSNFYTEKWADAWGT